MRQTFETSLSRFETNQKTDTNSIELKDAADPDILDDFIIEVFEIIDTYNNDQQANRIE
jgi:hypothetical protein